MRYPPDRRAPRRPALVPPPASASLDRRTFLGWCSGLLLAPAVVACSQPRSAAPGPQPAPTSAGAGAPTTPQALGTMRINWNSVSGAMSGIWMADEAGTWHDCGIEPELSNITSSSKVLPALIANDIDASALDVLVGVRGLAAGSDLVFLAGMTNRQVFSVFASPDVQRPADLAGQQWGITRVGSSTDVASHLALQQWGLTGDDITFVQLGTTANIFAALQSGQIAAGTISPPNTIFAKAAGLKELINLAEEGPEFPSVGLAMMRPDAQARPQLAECLVRGYAPGVKRLREDKDAAITIYRKYLRTHDPDVLEGMWDLFRRYLAWPPTIPAAGLERVRQEAAAEEPQAASITNEQIFDGRFVDQLQAQGLFG